MEDQSIIVIIFYLEVHIQRFVPSSGDSSSWSYYRTVTRPPEQN